MAYSCNSCNILRPFQIPARTTTPFCDSSGKAPHRPAEGMVAFWMKKQGHCVFDPIVYNHTNSTKKDQPVTYFLCSQLLPELLQAIPFFTLVLRFSSVAVKKCSIYINRLIADASSFFPSALENRSPLPAFLILVPFTHPCWLWIPHFIPTTLRNFFSSLGDTKIFEDIRSPFGKISKCINH